MSILVDADSTFIVQGITGREAVNLTRECLDYGEGAKVVFDFVAEQGAENDAWAMTAAGGSDYVIGYGGELRAPTLDFVAGEKNVIGNIVGTYADLAELFCTAQRCPVVVGNSLVFRDDNHVTIGHARMLAPVLEALAERALGPS